MKLLFFAVTNHQSRYFTNLSTHLDYKSRVMFFPSLRFSFKGLKLFNQINTQPALETKYKEMDVKYNNYLYKVLYKKLLQFQLPWLIMSVYKELNSYKPQYLIVWNGKKFYQEIAIEVAKVLGTKCLFFENGVLPNTTTMDFKGVNATNSLPKEISFYNNLFYQDKTLPKNLEVRVAKQAKNFFDSKPLEDYIFIPFQVAYDTQIIQHSPWIDSMFTFFEIIEWLSQKIGMVFVIKEHPSDRVSDYSMLHKQANKNIMFSSENTQVLVENAMAVMTINSSVGMESLLFKKRVIVLGEAFFAIEGIVKVANSKEDILQILNRLSEWKVDDALIDNFLCYLYYDYLIPTNWRMADEQHYRAIEDKIKEQVC